MAASGGGPDALAARAVLRLDDLPGDGWSADDDEEVEAGGAGGDDPSLDAALAGFPDDAVVGSATSPRFTRGDAIAWSVTWVLSTPAAAADATERLAGHAFASSFVDSVAASLEPAPDDPDGGPVVLGAVTDAAGPVPGGVAGVRHRSRVTAGTGEGALVVHLDLVALGAGGATSLLVVGDSPDPPADELVGTVAARLAERLPR